jgi:Kdo-III transferase WaaZ
MTLPRLEGSSLRLEGNKIVRLHQFAESRNSYSGAVFIVASGPSVLQFPMQDYRHIPMLAMNGSIARFIEEGIQPLFYLCDDKGVAARKLQAVAQGVSSAQNAALGWSALIEVAKHSPQALLEGKLHLMQRANRLVGQMLMSDRRFAWSNRHHPEYAVDWSLFHQKRNRIGFSRNLSNGYFNGRTIAYAALQLACHLGFEQVYLVGVDMNPEQGQFYDPQGQTIPSRLGDDYDDYILPCFELMAERVIKPDFQVYNLSLHSRLPAQLVPKLGLDQLDRLLASS